MRLILEPSPTGQAALSSSPCLNMDVTPQKHPKRFSPFAAFALKQHLPKNANVGWFGPLCCECFVITGRGFIVALGSGPSLEAGDKRIALQMGLWG